MARMVLVWGKPLRYPHGPEGKEYKTGDEFDALSERDAGHFEKIGAARRVEEKKKGRPPKVESVEPVVTTAQAEPAVEEPDKYKTRVMRPRGIT